MRRTMGYTGHMASLAMNPAYIALDVEDFLDLDLGDHKAELVDGVIYMMAGGSERHAAIAMNIGGALLNRLRGSGCRPYGSDMPLRTRERSIRFPDVTVYCGKEGTERLLDNPKVVFEVLSPSTAGNDQVVKLQEYLALAPVDHVVFVDPDRVRVRRIDRDGSGEWQDSGTDLDLPGLSISLTHDEIFAD
jgi:Uma2 family endonuclease